MVPKYMWFLLFTSALYVVYSNNYYTQVLKYVNNIYNEKIEVYLKSSSKQVVDNEGEILFTTSALNKFSNINDGLYLSILGQVFDVTIGIKHYGPGNTYHAFIGV